MASCTVLKLKDPRRNVEVKIDRSHILKSLKLIYNCSTLDLNCIRLQNNGIHRSLSRSIQSHCYQFAAVDRRYIAGILANVSAYTFSGHLVEDESIAGLLPVLKEWCCSDDLEVCLQAGRAVANLDVDYNGLLHRFPESSDHLTTMAELLDYKLHREAQKRCFIDAEKYADRYRYPHLPWEQIHDRYVDGVYLLHPLGQRMQHVDFAFDVVFVHGLKGNTLSSWSQITKAPMANTSRSSYPKTQCWPKDWLPLDISKGRILALDYESSVAFSTFKHPSKDLADEDKNNADDDDNDTNIGMDDDDNDTSIDTDDDDNDTNIDSDDDENNNILQLRSADALSKLKKAGLGRRPIIWIAHSMGGILIKKILLLNSKEMNCSIADNTLGCIFYATPHAGSPFAGAVPWFFPVSPEVKSLKPKNPYLQQLQADFLSLFAEKRHYCVLSFGETVADSLTMPFLRLNIPLTIIVPTESANPNCGKYILLDDTNHKEACKPDSPESLVYVKTVEFVKGVADGIGMWGTFKERENDCSVIPCYSSSWLLAARYQGYEHRWTERLEIDEQDAHGEKTVTVCQNECPRIYNGTSGRYEVLSPFHILMLMNKMFKTKNSSCADIRTRPATYSVDALPQIEWDELIVDYHEGMERSFSSYRANTLQNGLPRHQKTECGTCLGFAAELHAADCGHGFCYGCWRTYLSSKIMHENVTDKMECPRCDLILDKFFVMNVIQDELTVEQTYLRGITRSFVLKNPSMQWCPGANCLLGARMVCTKWASNNRSANVTCAGCHTIYCFRCAQPSHDPVSCALLDRWRTKCADEQETSCWLVANTKQCPDCHATIEKDGGCNHVVCGNLACKAEFCWVCLGQWRAHGSAWFVCDRYLEEDGRLARSVQDKSREALQRHVFYYGRYNNQKNSLRVETELHIAVKKRIEEQRWDDSREKKSGLSLNEMRVLDNAVSALRNSRRTLMFVYVFAYFMRRSNQVNQQQLFEINHDILRNATEMLSEYLERGTTWKLSIRGDMQAVQDLTRYCDGRCRVLVEHVHEGSDNNWWVLE